MSRVVIGLDPATRIGYGVIDAQDNVVLDAGIIEPDGDTLLASHRSMREQVMEIVLGHSLVAIGVEIPARSGWAPPKRGKDDRGYGQQSPMYAAYYGHRNGACLGILLDPALNLPLRLIPADQWGRAFPKRLKGDPDRGKPNRVRIVKSRFGLDLAEHFGDQEKQGDVADGLLLALYTRETATGDPPCKITRKKRRRRPSAQMDLIR